MSTSIWDYNVLIYLFAYYTLQTIPRLVHRNEQKFELADIIQGFPRFRVAVLLLPRITSGLTILLLLVVFTTWLSPRFAHSTTIHVIGLAYGAMLVFDAAFAWITGIRSIMGARQRYVVLQANSWKPMLQFTLSLLYLAVAIWFLRN